MDNTFVDTSQAVEIAPRVWWVASTLGHDSFQCHAYLFEQCDQSVLIDPGSALIADEVTRKVNDVVGLRDVRWLVGSRAGPDILGALLRVQPRSGAGIAGLRPASFPPAKRRVTARRS